VVVVTHELASIFAIGNDSIFLDPDTHTIGARGNPKELLEHCDNPVVHRFLSRGESQSVEDAVKNASEKDSIKSQTGGSVRSNG